MCLYCRGRLVLLDGDYAKSEEFLDIAFRHCDKRSYRNVRAILHYLIPVKLMLNKLPTVRASVWSTPPPSPHLLAAPRAVSRSACPPGRNSSSSFTPSVWPNTPSPAVPPRSTPQRKLLDDYSLADEYLPLTTAFRLGDVRAYEALLAEKMHELIVHGFFIMLEKVKVIVYRNFFKRWCVAPSLPPGGGRAG
jgi:hypothetical protein